MPKRHLLMVKLNLIVTSVTKWKSVLVTDLKLGVGGAWRYRSRKIAKIDFREELMQRSLWFAQHLRSRVDRSTPSITDMTSLADKSITLFSEALPLMALSAFQGIMELYVTRALMNFLLKSFPSHGESIKQRAVFNGRGTYLSYHKREWMARGLLIARKCLHVYARSNDLQLKKIL